MEVLNAVGLSSISSVLSRKPKKTISSSLKSPNVVNYNKNITKNTVNRLLCKHSSSHQTPLLTHPIFHHLKSASLPLSAITLPFFLESKDALAAGGEFGLLEGRSFALIHPIVMGVLFAYTLYTGYLGWQWRRVRTIQNEIGELKKEVKPVPVAPDGTPPQPLIPSPIESKIQQLTEERKELIKGSYRDKHFNAGSILLAFGVFESIGGGLNTWLRTGKLFPGPHLFAGAAITVLWAAAAALVPPMQKGNETARSLHIALNAVNVLLFIWQIPTGLDIVLKVFEFTKWP
ncbi:hypothetical protein DCAR_0209774 [Daucus carota subsp. sativus]|uniref:Uncharacterized protein n=1 Tax=Daucus carota subsp. sativus TaxID=79200 RepID=A0AAF0WII1_DAUCS|nr:PREDICTED: uncharacterized protein LOC108209177 isoform X1 [Daucus carota subsp. sativus]WOG90530.1 hypothetical protein DCAR_0209774 [Daucus carota subsp. sativus]